MSRPKHAPYFAALLAELLVFHWRVLFQPGSLFPWDFRGVHLPLATFVANSIRRGEWPLWDPYTYCGYPIFANIQTALFYPPVLLATFAGSLLGPEHLPRFLAWAVVAQIFFAGACTFLLMKRLGASGEAAFLAATVYQLGCFFASQAEHMGAMQGAAWLPLIWWCVLGLREGLRWSWLALLSLALSMTVLAGLPQVAVAAFGSALVVAALMAAMGLARRLLPVQVLLAWAWGLLLAAIQVIPTAQLTHYSVAKFRADWLKTGGGIKLGALYSLVIPNYWSVFDLSKFHGPSDPTFLYLYCSLLGLILAVAVMLWKPDRWVRVFGLLTLAAAVWMLGDSTPLGRTVFLALPVDIRIGIHPEFTLPVFALGIAMLAGFGASRFLKPRVQLAAAAIVAIDLIAVSSGRPFNVASVKTEPGVTHDSIDGSADLASRLRALTSAANPPFRFDMGDAPYAWSQTAPVLEIPTANGCDPMAPERIIQVRLSFAPGERWGACYQVVNGASPAIGLENVRYVLSRAPMQGMKSIAHIAGYDFYENPTVLPRAFFAAQVQPAVDLADAARRLHMADFDPAQIAIVEGTASALGTAAASIEVAGFRANHLTLRTHSNRDAFLVITDAWYPGWEASVDGQPTSIYITDVAFRGIAVPGGDHTISMQFVPRILYWSALVSVLAVLAVLHAARPGMRRRRDRLSG